MPDGIEPYIHTTDILAGNDPFSRKNGWDSLKVDALLSECSLLIADISRARIIRGVACSVLLKDYRIVKHEGLPLASVEDICSSFCVARSVAWNTEFAEEFMNDGAELYFDRNGPFYGSIMNRRRHGKLRTNEAWNKLRQV